MSVAVLAWEGNDVGVGMALGKAAQVPGRAIARKVASLGKARPAGGKSVVSLENKK